MQSLTNKKIIKENNQTIEWTAESAIEQKKINFCITSNNKLNNQFEARMPIVKFNDEINLSI